MTSSRLVDKGVQRGCLDLLDALEDVVLLRHRSVGRFDSIQSLGSDLVDGDNVVRGNCNESSVVMPCDQ